jgi:hypothetical protein
MSTYYKYAERNADSQVNWAEVGKGISNMLADETKIREEKKAAYETAFQDDMKQLSTQPQGDWQDGTNVVNNFAHNMMAQKLIDYKLLKSGRMKPRDYTLRQQNYTNQTNSVLDLNKRLQDKRGKAIAAYQAGNLQAMSISDLSDVQEYTDFANAEIIIDPYSSAFSMGKMEEQIINGEKVRVVSKNTLPVNIASILIESNKLPYDVNRDIDNTVKGFGTQINVLRDLATQTKAGSITKLTGIGAYEATKNPQFKKEIDLFNKAVDQKITEFITNKDNLASILTTQLNYNAESFTRSPEVAKEKGKILKKIDPITHFSTLDESGPNYKEQVKEASDWIRTQILSKMDNKVEVELGGFAPQPRQPSQYEYERADARKSASVLGEQISNLITGDANKIATSIAYIEGMNNVDRVVKGKDAITITTRDKDGELFTNSYPLSGMNAGDIGKSLLNQLNPEKLPQTTVTDYINKFNKNKKVNLADTLTGKKTVQTFDVPVNTAGVGSKY